MYPDGLFVYVYYRGTAGYLRTQFVTRVSLGGKTIWLFPWLHWRLLWNQTLLYPIHKKLWKGYACHSPGSVAFSAIASLQVDLTLWLERYLKQVVACCSLISSYVSCQVCQEQSLKHDFLQNDAFSSVIVVLCTGLLPHFCSPSVNNVLQLQGWKATFVDSLFVLMPVQGTVSLCQFADVEVATAWELLLCTKVWLKITAD